MKMKAQKIFVTVGTTQFPKLIDKICSEAVLNILSNLEYDSIQIQCGQAPEQIELCRGISAKSKIRTKDGSLYVHYDTKMTLKFDKFLDNFEEEIKKSDLIISHAGAGTCLEVLHQHKPLLTVINEDLMDNHQTELAEQLQKLGYLYFCTCDTLINNIKKDFTKLKPYPLPQSHTFANYINVSLGYNN